MDATVEQTAASLPVLGSGQSIAVASRHGVLPGDFMLVFLPRIQSVSPGEFPSKLRTADGRSLSIAE